MASVFDYIFNIGGNFSAQINGMSAAAGSFSASVEGADSGVRRFTGTLATFSYLKDVFQNVADGVTALSSAGITLDSQMHDLSAVAGVTGDGLKQIEKFARESAKAFGTDASVAVEGYKLLLSQLSPELGKYPEALRSMGDCIQRTSKLMGGDGVAAAQVLTTAMNQYGVSLEDPTAASEEMARMMNVMAAPGQAGSAELPAISAALQQCGMAAKAANVSFEETNAAIQVLDKAGKKASEGGVALRNVLGQLSKGRFVEKQAAEELQKAGIDVTALGDNTKSLKERLEMLKPMLNDSALLSKFFGVENANAARALIQGTDALEDFTTAVTGTSSATDQAAIVMDAMPENIEDINTRNNINSYTFSNFATPIGEAEGKNRFVKIDLPTIGFNVTEIISNKSDESNRNGETVENVGMATKIVRYAGIGIDNLTQIFGYVKENPELNLRIHRRGQNQRCRVQEQRNESERRERLLATELEKLRASDYKGQANDTLARNEIKDLVMETIIDSLR